MSDAMDPFEAYATSYATLARAIPGFQIVPVARPGSLQCAVTQFALANVNRVMAVRLADDEVEDAIEAVMAAHSAAGVPGSWWLDPGATPAGIVAALQRRGYAATSPAPVMVSDLRDLPDVVLPAGVDLHVVHGREAMYQAQLLIGTGFGRPMEIVQEMAAVIAPSGDLAESPVRMVLATLDGVPVSVASGVLSGTICGVHNVATLPEARGKGLARATTLAVLHDAIDRGCRMGVLHASVMGFSIYARLGFRHVGDFRRYANE